MSSLRRLSMPSSNGTGGHVKNALRAIHLGVGALVDTAHVCSTIHEVIGVLLFQVMVH